jgi:hypothetical protein
MGSAGLGSYLLIFVLTSPTDRVIGDARLVLMLSALHRDRGMDHAVDANGAHELYESGVVDSGCRRECCAVCLRSDELSVGRNERNASPLDIRALGLALECPAGITALTRHSHAAWISGGSTRRFVFETRSAAKKARAIRLA